MDVVVKRLGTIGGDAVKDLIRDDVHLIEDTLPGRCGHRRVWLVFQLLPPARAGEGAGELRQAPRLPTNIGRGQNSVSVPFSAFGNRNDTNFFPISSRLPFPCRKVEYSRNAGCGRLVAHCTTKSNTPTAVAAVFSRSSSVASGKPRRMANSR